MTTNNASHSKALAAFDDILPLLHQTARIVKDCPFNDPTDRINLSIMVAGYFVSSAVGILDKEHPDQSNAERLIAALAKEVAAHNASRKGETP